MEKCEDWKNGSRHSKYVYVRYIILSKSSRNADEYDIFGRFVFYKMAKSGHSINSPRIKERAGQSVRIFYSGDSFILQDLG